MKRSELSLARDLATFPRAGGAEAPLAMNATAADGAPAQLLGAVRLGSDVARWLAAFHRATEGLFGGLPSCFHYHAAAAFPRPLLYAAELVCVLVGAKGVAMVQDES